MDWLELLIGAVALALFLVFGIAGAVAVMVARMVRRGIRLEPAEEAGYPRDFATVREVDAWAKDQGFDLIGCYIAHLLSPGFVAAWKHRQRPTYFCLYGVQHVYAHEFVTVFAEDRMLTTANTPDAQLFPRPDGYYLQSFDKLPLDDLLTRHAAAEHYLMQQGRLREESLAGSFEEHLAHAFARQMAYIETLPLWQLRGGYWFLIRKDRYHRKTIEELHDAQKAPFPHEPTFREFTR